MKRFAMILLGCALIMGMSQCKKDNTNTTNNESVRITFTANGGQDSRTEVSDYGVFTWSYGDEYVFVGGSINGYLGVLLGSGDSNETTRPFSGEIKQPDNGEILHFFYLGKGVTERPASDIISFATQAGTQSDVTAKHIAIGSAKYVSGTSNYNADLKMKMAIGRFNIGKFYSGSGDITVSGDYIYNQASIDWNNGEINVSSEKGDITIATGCNVNDFYVAFLPNNPAEGNDINFTVGGQKGTIFFREGIKEGQLYQASAATPLSVEPNNP